MFEKLLVYKFGGASIESSERIKNVGEIIAKQKLNKLVVVVSALGKTTNLLEQYVSYYFHQDKGNAYLVLEKLIHNHDDIARQLFVQLPATLSEQLNSHYQDLKTFIDKPIDENLYDFYYDQIVCYGELLSTSILSYYLTSIQLQNCLVDARNMIKTDDTHRGPQLLLSETEQLVTQQIHSQFSKSNLIITQGFIGSNAKQHAVTLGREGSDYTAALLANILNAQSVTIWKDVPSLLNADPKLFPNTVPIEEITYHEVIEMAYYGAQVIHPKTIKPLQNKNIPLYVRCFLDDTLKGTVIKNKTDVFIYPPIIVLKKNQLLIQVTTKDYSFITEDNLSKLYTLFHLQKIKINMIQNAAISFVACIDNDDELKLQKLLTTLETDYEIKRNENVQLLTIRHYTPSVIEEITKGRTLLLEQKTRNTIQLVIK